MNKESTQELELFAARARTLIKWVAVDACGGVWGYSSQPTISKWGEFWVSDEQEFYVGVTQCEELRKNWKKALVKL